MLFILFATFSSGLLSLFCEQVQRSRIERTDKDLRKGFMPRRIFFTACGEVSENYAGLAPLNFLKNILPNSAPPGVSVGSPFRCSGGGVTL